MQNHFILVDRIYFKVRNVDLLVKFLFSLKQCTYSREDGTLLTEFRYIT